MTLPGPVTAEYLRAWARHTHRSPLYAHLIELTASHPDLLAIIQRIHNRPPPNVYLAAIHYLLTGDQQETLAHYYASIVDEPRPVDEVDGSFIEFVTTHQDRIVEIANARLTQTNECRRCVALLPGMMTAPFDVFHLVEIGTSAGLNLSIDRYRYVLGDSTWGPQSDLVLSAATPGDPPRLREITIESRTGIDINIIDRDDPDELRWLDALVWPEHEERRARLQAALELTREVEVNLVEGSVLDTLGPVLAGLPDGEPVVVMNSFVLNQLDPAQRDRVSGIIDEARSSRRIYRVSLEFIDKDDDWARLEVGEGMELTPLGTAHPHGEWVELDYSTLG